MRVRPFITGFAIVLGACGTAWTVDKFEAPEAGFAHRRTYGWKDSEFGLPAEVDPAALERADRALRSRSIPSSRARATSAPRAPTAPTCS
jgi:hypothetical protein